MSNKRRAVMVGLCAVAMLVVIALQGCAICDLICPGYGQTIYIMQGHETLASIAQKYYGSAEKVTRIWEANPTLPRTRGPLPAGTKVIITPIFPRQKCSQAEPAEQKKSSTAQCKQTEKASLSSRGATIPTE